MMKKSVQQAINRHINAELASSYLYLSMAAYFESVNFSGFAHWLRVQSSEEYTHAMKFFGHLIERGEKVTLAKLDAPKLEWKSPLAVFEDVYKHEVKISSLINACMTLAKKEEDYPTEIFLQGFVTEQIEEEASALSILEQLKLIKDSPNSLFMLNHQLGERK